MFLAQTVKTGDHNMTEMLLKVVLNTYNVIYINICCSYSIEPIDEEAEREADDSDIDIDDSFMEDDDTITSKVKLFTITPKVKSFTINSKVKSFTITPKVKSFNLQQSLMIP